MEFTDRYQALGIPYPNPETMCQGQCEGTGYIPVYISKGNSSIEPIEIENNSELIRLWQEAEAKHPTDDGWHFVVCPDCNGTRLRK